MSATNDNAATYDGYLHSSAISRRRDEVDVDTRSKAFDDFDEMIRIILRMSRRHKA